jgi:hypothetical protein
LTVTVQARANFGGLALAKGHSVVLHGHQV